jgi:uncharacterized protein
MIRTLPQLDFDPVKLEELCQRWQIIELSVFGSAARNEMRPDSDVDLMVKFAPASKVSLWDLVTLKDDLAAIFDRDVDVITQWPVENPYRRASIAKDLTLLYAA